MARYAVGTEIPAEQSRAEIEKVIVRYGCREFSYGQKPGEAWITFVLKDRRVAFHLPLPDPASPEFTRTPTQGRLRSADSRRQAYDQAVRQRWRALLLSIKAKLEAVECKISSFEAEFLAHIVMPNGSVLGQVIIPHLDALGKGESQLQIEDKR